MQVRMKVRRTTVETGFVEIPIDPDEFAEWAGQTLEDAPYALVAEYVEADAGFPANVQALGLSAEWGVNYIETELPR